MTPSTKSADPALDILAAEIDGLSSGVKRLLSGRLTERAIVTLIYDAMPNKIVGKAGIKEVLNCASSLGELSLRRLKPNGDKKC